MGRWARRRREWGREDRLVGNEGQFGPGAGRWRGWGALAVTAAAAAAGV